MRASHPSRSPPPPRDLDGATPRPHRGASPVLYESAPRAARASSVDSVPARSLPEGTGPFVHEIYSPAAGSPTAFFHDKFQNPPDALLQLKLSEPSSSAAHTPSPPTDAPAPLADMPDRRPSAQDNRPPGPRGRSYSGAAHGRGAPGRPPQPYQPAAPQHPPAHPSDAHQGPPNYPHMHGQFPPPPAPYAQRGPYMGGQYALSPPAGMGHPQSPPQYTYSSHPGLVAQDGGMHPPGPHMRFAQNALLMQPQTPVYPYSPHGPSPESASSSSSYAGTPNTNPQMYPPPHASPPPHSPHAPPGSSPYNVRYSSPAYGYPQQSFAHSGNALYPSQYPYGQQQFHPPPTEQEGRWWYVPPTSGPPPSAHYETYAPQYQVYNPMAQRELEYSQHHHSAPVLQPPGGYQNQPYPYSASAPPQLTLPGADPPPPIPREPPPRVVSEPARSEAQPSSSPSLVPQDGPVRRAHHPNPPSNRSEWVMWAGNVPSDATPDELWRFFNQPPSPASTAGSLPSQASAPAALPAPPTAVAAAAAPPTAGAGPVYGGVASVFLIARSNCAFVNFASEAHLRAAIAHFNGTPLRGADPRCARLVCRVRAREDDLKAGVGGQRGAGMHTQWVREQRRRAREAASPAPSVGASTSASAASDATDALGALSLASEDEGGAARRAKRGARHSSSGGSYASTNSSLLSQHFPKRYFILKSLTQYDLDLSVEKGLWATQRHNEGILDQAYRTSKDVYLIFGVNKSGEFYGYARMAGPVLRGEQRVPWASRSSIDSPPPPGRRATTPAGASASASPPSARLPQYLSPSDVGRYEESPQPMDAPPSAAGENAPPGARGVASAPAVLHHRHRPLSKASAGAPLPGELSYDERRLRPAAPPLLAAAAAAASDEDFELDPAAPLRAVKHPPYADAEGIRRWDAAVGESLLDAVEEEEEHGGTPAALQEPAAGAAADAEGEGEGPVWGESFRVEWLRVARLPFYRTRHLRNPWNHDREVKVSRDGTELEPGVGAAMLEEWDRPEPPPPPPGAGAGAGGKAAAGRRQARE